MEKWLSLFDACSGICTDSRQIQRDCMYIALRGANFYGNQYAQQAIEAGAKFAVVDNATYANGENILLVANGLSFLQDLAQAHRLRFDIPVIGITGSNGKTSTKELVNCILQTQFKVLCTEGNLNNHIGVPLTLLQLNQNHEIAIIEMGANKPLDIDELCLIASPTHGLITNIGKAHLEGFVNFEGVLKTKSELYDHVAQHNGGLFVNGDDPILLAAAQQRHIALCTYGAQAGELKGQLQALDPFVHLSWTHATYSSEVIHTQMIGKYNFYNFLAALRVGLHFGIDPEKMNEAISHYVPTNKRSQVEKTAHNTLIIDCYNANPSSMMSALSSFLEIEHPYKLSILGDMLELGQEGPSEHQKVLDFLIENSITFITIGPIFQKLHPEGYLNATELQNKLQNEKISSHLILLKGSRGLALEELIVCL